MERFPLPHLQVVLTCLLVLHSGEPAYFFLLQQQLHESHLNYLQKGKKNMIRLSCLGTKGIFDIFTICSQNP